MPSGGGRKPESISNPKDLFSWIEQVEDDVDEIDDGLAEVVDDVVDHVNNVSNPHGVTKSQVGLANADNTSDANKPISTAVQNVFDYIDPGSAGDHRTALSWEEDGTPSKAGIPVSPLLFGAVGDGATDDTDAILGMITALGLEGGASLADGTGIIVDGHSRTYLVTEPIVFSDVWWLRLRNFHFLVGANVADVLLLKGVSYSEFSNILITGVGNWAGFTADYCVRVESNQGVTVAEGVSAQNKFTDVRVIDIKHKWAFAFGPDSAGNQVSEIGLFGCQCTGNSNVDSPDATWYQAGFLFGQSVAGNTLNFNTYGCYANGYTYGVDIYNTNVSWYGGSSDQSVQSFRHRGSGNFLASGLRSEGCRRFLTTSTGTSISLGVTIQSLTFTCNELHADEYWIIWSTPGSLKLNDISLGDIDVGIEPKVQMESGQGGNLEIHGMTNYAPVESAYSIGLSNALITGYTERDPDDDSIVKHTPLHQVGESVFDGDILVDGDIVVDGNVDHEWLAKNYVTSNVTNTVQATPVAITGLSFAIGANEVWQFDAALATACSSTGGVKITWTYPTGMTHKAQQGGAGGSVNLFTSSPMPLSGIGSVVDFNKFAGDGNAWVRGVAINGSTAGTVQLMIAPVTDTQTATAYAGGSYIVAHRLV